MNLIEIERQIQDLLDGLLSDEEIEALEAVLRANPDALETYVEIVDLHNALETRLGVGITKSMPMDRIIARQMRGVARKSLFAAAAILVGMAVAMAIFYVSAPPSAVAVITVTPDSQYRLEHDGNSKPPKEGQLTVGSRLVLSQGAFEGVFANGVHMVAEAPCNLRILSNDRVAIDAGTAWFRVPPEAQGFVAETPEIVVRDLGTEFGILSKPKDFDEVHVLVGSVEVMARSESAPALILQAGMARRLGTNGELVETEANSSHFRRQLVGKSGAISNFDFEGPAWTAAKQSDFKAFAASAVSADTDAMTHTSVLSNNGYNAGGYGSFYIRDADINTSIFSASATPGAGMNVAGADQTVPTNYISFTVTPDSGCQTTYESLSFYTDVNGADDAYNVELRAWSGGVETQLGSIEHKTGSILNDPVEFKSIDFPDFTSDQPVEFRLYGYNVDSPNSGIRYDDIVLMGRSSVALSAKPAD